MSTWLASSAMCWNTVDDFVGVLVGGGAPNFGANTVDDFVGVLVGGSAQADLLQASRHFGQALRRTRGEVLGLDTRPLLSLAPGPADPVEQTSATPPAQLGCKPRVPPKRKGDRGACGACDPCSGNG
jgi:hypothetical protein